MTKAQREMDEYIYLFQFIHLGLHADFVHSQIYGGFNTGFIDARAAQVCTAFPTATW